MSNTQRITDVDAQIDKLVKNTFTSISANGVAVQLATIKELLEVRQLLTQEDANNKKIRVMRAVPTY